MEEIVFKDKLVVLESELNAFKVRHPEYNYYEELYDKDGILAGYTAAIVK